MCCLIVTLYVFPCRLCLVVLVCLVHYGRSHFLLSFLPCIFFCCIPSVVVAFNQLPSHLKMISFHKSSHHFGCVAVKAFVEWAFPRCCSLDSQLASSYHFLILVYMSESQVVRQKANLLIFLQSDSDTAHYLMEVVKNHLWL